MALARVPESPDPSPPRGAASAPPINGARSWRSPACPSHPTRHRRAGRRPRRQSTEPDHGARPRARVTRPVTAARGGVRAANQRSPIMALARVPESPDPSPPRGAASAPPINGARSWRSPACPSHPTRHRRAGRRPRRQSTEPDHGARPRARVTRPVTAARGGVRAANQRSPIMALARVPESPDPSPPRGAASAPPINGARSWRSPACPSHPTRHRRAGRRSRRQSTRRWIASTHSASGATKAMRA